ncbi:MAG: prepilin-type N-terminal cleavage/methylation domain-containing protein [Gammaproteobacteria bacterium]|nr:prepilin-type N-terminal cleavage/methylation domain-containing protein [Gammaproteobacteria bacterium]MDH5628962.1 prepilin-type N-terminal cleavage/methylation domain-containing protein [Gammaproteobacteria bacterium]
MFKVYQISKYNRGFTLIELIVVIVILGIMAAIAGPKFIDLQAEARSSVMGGVEGAVRGAATLIYSKSLIEGEESLDETAATPPSVLVQGATVATKFGYPNAGTSGTPVSDGLAASLELQGDIIASSDGSTVTFTYGTYTTCTVTYAESAAAGSAPVVINNAIPANC